MTVAPSQSSPRPTLAAESAFWNHGYQLVAGVDEVGRGAWAGPLVAGAVVLPCCSGERQIDLLITLRAVRDSKQLTGALREELATFIRRESLAVGLGWVSNVELDQVGVSAANRLAIERAVGDLPDFPEAVLLDARITELDVCQVGIIKGDQRSLTIAAASIVAKVARDQYMGGLEPDAVVYDFAAHKGYGTPTHSRALRQHGPCGHHRLSFALPPCDQPPAAGLAP